MRSDDGRLLSVKDLILNLQQSPEAMGYREDLLTEIREEDGLTAGAGSAEAFAHRWGVILAGGDGVRLRGLTRIISGDDRPKQFCRILGESTLLEVTRRRAERTIKPDQIIYSVTRSHQDYYIHGFAGQASQRVVQPCNRGTAPAIISSLLRVARVDPDATVAIFPCDHHYSEEQVFTKALDAAYAVAEDQPEMVVLLGAQPKGPEVEYGWIEINKAVRGTNKDLYQVVRFHEKPALPVAERLLRNGCLWNTFVMVGKVNAFLNIATASVPAIVETLSSVPMTANTETHISDWVYNLIQPTDFSRQVLTPAADRLLTLRLCNAGWNDLGDPERVMSVLEQNGEFPRWAVRWRAGHQLDRGAEQAVLVAVG